MEYSNVLGLQNTWIEWILAGIGVLAFIYFLVRAICVRTESTLALRNVIRNTRRSIITIVAIGCAVAGSILLGNYFLETYRGLRETTIRSELGHIILMKEDFFEKGRSSPGEYMFEEYEEIEATLLQDPDIDTAVEFITTEINFNGIVTGPTGKKSINFLGIAGEPEDSSITATLDINEGAQLDPDADDEVMLGKGLASQLGVEIGDYVTVLSTTPFGGIDVLDAELIGIVDTFSRDFGDVLLRTSVGFAQSILSVKGVNKLVIMLNDTRDTNTVYAKIQGIVANHPEWGLRVYRWDELTDYYLQVRQLFNNIYSVVSTILFILIIFLVLNTVTMSVYERFSEFGTLRAIGLKGKSLISLVLIEGVYLAIFGVLLGMAIVYITAYTLFSLGLTVDSPPGFTRPYPFDIRVKYNVDYYILIAKSIFICFGTVLLASFTPARRAANLKIVDCLRENQ